ncbi:MAG: SDR family NAD(P)-dependent oxidoreductase [Alphaproteobacteria bacterium]|nr:SDR family NAD(P)-dependent oxidoreductase [Alphaproteobacteria bacterium]
MSPYRSALITGASSGIGRALSLALAGPGAALHLSGRDATRLDDTATACRAKGATVQAAVLDVTDAASMAAWIAAAGPLDLVVANAGISGGTGNGAGETAAQTRAIFAVNLDGALNTVLPALEAMRAQPARGGKRGTIAVIASIAALLPTPNAPAYGASKAAIDTWARASSPAAAAAGILLASVCPGFIRTAMTAANRYKMPGLMEADQAAQIILAGLAAGRDRIIFPWWMGLVARIVGALPFGRRLLARQGSKAALPDPARSGT